MHDDHHHYQHPHLPHRHRLVQRRSEAAGGDLSDLAGAVLRKDFRVAARRRLHAGDAHPT
jgi:hypothetical protein